MAEREQDILMQQEAVWFSLHCRGNLGAKAEYGSQAGEGVHPHAQVNHHEVGVVRQIDSFALWALRHGPPWRQSYRKCRPWSLRSRRADGATCLGKIPEAARTGAISTFLLEDQPEAE